MNSTQSSSLGRLPNLTFSPMALRHLFDDSNHNGGNLTGTSSGEVLSLLKQALRISIEESQIGMCRMIISRGIKSNTPVDTCNSCNALAMSIRLQKPDLVKLFIQRGADVNAKLCAAHPLAGLDAAHYAARTGDSDLLRLVLSNGYDSYLSPIPPLLTAIYAKSIPCALLALDAPIHSAMPIISMDGIASPNSKRPIVNLPIRCEPSERPWGLAGACKLATAIGVAVATNNQEMIDLLLSRGADVNATDDQGWTPLHIAASNMALETIKKLLKHGARLDLKDKIAGRTPIWMALDRMHVDSVILLLTSESASHRKSGGWTPLHRAAELGNMELITKLLDMGVAIDATSDLNLSALHLACCIHPEAQALVTSKLLVDRGAKVDIRNDKGETPLMFATSRGYQSVCESLLKLGADTLAMSTIARSTLHIACVIYNEKQSLKMCEVLISFGVSINARDWVGRTPLMYAAYLGHLSVCKRLVMLGADALAASFASQSALTDAFQQGRHDIVERLSEEYKPLVELKNDHGCTPVHFAMTSSDRETHKLALEHRKELEFDCHEGCGSLLNRACLNSRAEVVKDITLQVDSPTFKKLCLKSNHITSPPLISCVKRGDQQCMSILLDAGTDIEIHSKHWDTPLITACKLGRLEIVKMLVRRGARLNYVDDQGTEVSAIEACKFQKPTLEWLENYLKEKEKESRDVDESDVSSNSTITEVD